MVDNIALNKKENTRMKDIRFIFFTYPLIIIFNITTKLIGYVWTYLIAIQGAEIYGKFSLVMSFIAIFSGISNMWIIKQTTRNIIVSRERKGENKAKQTIYFMTYLSFFSSLFFMVIVLLFSKQIASLVYKDIQLSTIFIYTSIVLFLILPLKNYSAYLSSKRKIIFSSFLSSIGMAFLKLLALILFFYYLRTDKLIGAVFSHLLSSVTITIIIYIYTAKKYNLYLPSPLKVIKDIKEYGYILKESSFFGISRIISLISNQANTILINYFLGAIQTGIYNITSPFISVIQLLSRSLIAPLSLIIIEKINQKKEKEINILLNYSIKYSLILLLFIYAIYILYGREIISTIFGKEYASAYKVLIILTPAYILMFLGNIYFNIFWSKNTPSYLPYLTTVTGITNILLNLLLIPIYGIIGSAIASLVSLSLTSLFHIYKSLNTIKLNISFKDLLVSFILSILSLILLNRIIHRYVKYIDIKLGIILIFLSGMVYLLFLFMLKILTIKEIRKIYTIIKEIIDIKNNKTK